MPDHVVLNPETTDVRDALKELMPEDASLVMLSSRKQITPWNEPVIWMHGGSIDNLCQRFKRYRNTQSSDLTWVVVVDMGKTAPVSKAYNQLFKNNHIKVVTVSSDKATLKDYRFSRCVADDYDDLVKDDSASPVKPTSSWWPF
jgi:hypothetical protein